ncbi:MAG: hypothetical protein ACRDHP_03100, partial [Ktedonobacterales bacterium]
SYGIGFRVDAQAQKQSVFYIDGSGGWLVLGPSGVLVSPRSSSALRQGLHATNTLEVDCSGATVTFFLNGVNVGSVSDGAVTSGGIALFVETDQYFSGTQVIFTNFRVTQWQ